MEEYIKSLEEQNKILKELNDVNNRLIDSHREITRIKDQIILLLKEKLKKYEDS
jgi:uncharacterized coiled-coil protein SlyX